MDSPKNTTTIAAAVVERLCYYMEKQKLTQYKLAQLSNLPFTTVKSIMQKKTKGISLKTIVLLSYGLGITPSEFLGDDLFLGDNLLLD